MYVPLENSGVYFVDGDGVNLNHEWSLSIEIPSNNLTKSTLPVAPFTNMV